MRWSRLIPWVLLALLAASASAGVVVPMLFDPEPIDSRDLKRLLEHAGFAPDQRQTVEAAFDAHVERWQHLRDEVVRAFDRKSFGLMLEVDRELQRRDQITPESLNRYSGVEAADEPDGWLLEQETLDPSVERRARALERLRRRIVHRIEATERDFIASLQSIAQSEAQRDSIDLFAQRRRIAWSVAVLRSTVQPDFRGLDDVPELPVRLRDPDVRARASARILQLGRDHADHAYRAAERALVGDSVRPEPLIDALIRLRLKAIDEIAAMMPEDLGEPWSRSNRDALLERQVRRSSGMLSHAALSAVLGDRFSPDVAERLKRWRADRRLFEDRLLLPKTPEDVPVYPMGQRQLDWIDAQAVTDIASVSGVQDLALQLERWSESQPETDQADDAEVGASEPVDPRLSETPSIHDEMIDPMAAEFSEHIGDSSEWPMSLPRLRAIHDALEVPEANEAVWNMLVTDFRDHGLEILRSMPAPSPRFLVHEFETMVQLRAKVQRLENEFFDTLEAALPDAAPGSVERQRVRRSHERLVGRVRGMTLERGYLSDSLSIIDPFDAIDGLSPEVRRMIDAPVMQWLNRRDAALRALCELDDAYRRADARLQRDQHQWQAHFRTMNRLSVESARIMRQAEQAAEREMSEILDTMPIDDAWRLKRSIRLLSLPEVCRDLREFERLLDRAYPIEELGAEQRERLLAIRNESRERAATLVERIAAHTRSIRELDLEQRVESDENADTPSELDDDAEIVRRQRQQLESNRLTDLSWDLKELQARTRRRLEAAIDRGARAMHETP